MVPGLLDFTAKYEGHQLRSKAGESFMRKYFGYLFVAVVLLPILSMSLYGLGEYLNSDTSSAEDIFERIFAKSSGNQFLVYVIDFALLSTPLELFKLAERVCVWWNDVLARCGKYGSEDGVRGRVGDGSTHTGFDYAFNYAITLHILSVVMFFSTVSPLIVSFGAVFLSFKHFVDRFNILCFHPRGANMAAGMVRSAVHIVVVIVAMAQFATFGYLQVKRAHGPSMVVLATFCLTSLVYLIGELIPESKKELELRKSLPQSTRHLVGHGGNATPTPSVPGREHTQYPP